MNNMKSFQCAIFSGFRCAGFKLTVKNAQVKISD